MKNYSSIELQLEFIAFSILLSVSSAFGQTNNDWQLDRWPPDLETEFALSALPSHLRSQATVYLLDPTTGYYIGRQGTNGFSCFVSRTEWEWADFAKDHAAPISYDAEGSKTILKVFLEVASMRASGKYTAMQIRDTVIQRVKNGIYKAPSKPGISYMLAPMMRTYPGTKEIVSMHLPHYMFYAPYLTNEDIGGKPASEHPVVFSPSENVLGVGKSPFNYIVLPAGKIESARIIEEHKSLLKRLAEYKSYLRVESNEQHH
jgi:hypothetical protein